MMKRGAAAIVLATLTSLALGQDALLRVLDNANLQGWESKEFKGETSYTPVREGGLSVIKAESRASASGMFRELTINLEQTPYLNWRWRVDGVLSGNDERSKGGDDYPARVYVVVSGGLFFWKTRAVNYVWSTHLPAGSAWPNAFTGNAQMLAVRTGAAEAGAWVEEKRNVREDLRQLFGEDIKEIHGVAFMTDTDNTGQTATAYYGDIFFSSK